MFNAVKKFLSKVVSSATPSFDSSEVTEVQTTLPPTETFLQSEVVVNEPKIKQLKRQITSKEQKQ